LKRIRIIGQWVALVLVFFFMGTVGIKDDHEVDAVPNDAYEKLRIFTDVLEG